MKLSTAELRSISAKLQEELGGLINTDARLLRVMRDTQVPLGGDAGDQSDAVHLQGLAAALGNGSGAKLTDILEAKRKLKEGEFGDCERCGEVIALARLKAIPSARFCIDCQRAVDEEKRRGDTDGFEEERRDARRNSRV